MNNCPFCNIKPKYRILEKNNSAIAFLAKDAISVGQAIVIPMRHISSIVDATDDEVCSIFALLKKFSSALTAAYDYNGFNIISNTGVSAGQTIDHLHFHLIPRKNGDTTDSRKWLCEDFFKKLYQPIPDEFREAQRNLSLFSKSIQNEALSYHPTKIGRNIVIGKNVTFGRSVTLYPDTTIGDNSYIGDFVSIGYRDLRMGLSDDITSIGEDSIVRSGSTIYCGTRIGFNFDCAHNVLIRSNTTIGDNCYILPNTQIHSHVKIGNNARIQGFVCNRAVVGNDSSTLGSLVHKFRTRRSGDIEDSPVIESNVVVGIGSIIIGGVKIGKGSTVGAGAIVTKDVKEGETYFETR